VEFTRIWRAKQFEYCYLRTITGRFADFSLVTEDALVYAAEAMHLELKGDTRQRLLNAYLNLKPWPDAADGLRKLRAAGCASSRFPSSAAACSAPMPSTQA
jgi:2-haloacid dehalogenase